MRQKYLDGLRGWAALVVVFTHVVRGVFWPGWKPALQPFFTDGSLAVGIFFVLSGYVLTITYFETSSRRVIVDLALRRYPRLTLPILGISLIALFLMSNGLMFNVAAGNAAGSKDWLAIFYTFDPSVSGMLKFALLTVYIDPSPMHSYDSSLWTMPLEMVGSLFIFAAVGIAGRSFVAQMAAFLGFTLAAVLLRSMFLAMVLGVGLARLTQSATHRRLMMNPASQRWSWILIVGALAVAAARKQTLEPLILPICSAAIFYATLLNRTMQEALCSRLSQWLGKISFSLYLVHVLVICSLSSWLYLQLAPDGVLSPSGVGVIFIATLGASLAAAAAFYPIESLGIMGGRALSRLCLQTGPATRLT